jgi:hypothetical protein
LVVESEDPGPIELPSRREAQPDWHIPRSRPTELAPAIDQLPSAAGIDRFRGTGDSGAKLENPAHPQRGSGVGNYDVARGTRFSREKVADPRRAIGWTGHSDLVDRAGRKSEIFRAPSQLRDSARFDETNPRLSVENDFVEAG